MASEPAIELSFGDPGVLAEGAEDLPAGLGPWKLAMRRLRRNKLALAFGVLFVAIVVLCLLAPFYASHIAHTDPFQNHLTDQVKVNGKLTDVVSPDGIPIGPTWHGRFFLGADGNGRDVAVRLLYGCRSSSARSPATSAAGRTRSCRGRWTSCGRSRRCCSGWRSARRSRSAG